MKETTLNNKNVLLEALEYIDRDLIAETVEELKAPPMRQAPERDKSVTRKSIKYTLLLAACLVLVSAIIPVVFMLALGFFARKFGIISVEQAQNLVIVKCYSGMAQGVCAAIDSLERDDVIGSIAGDDTIFLAARDNSFAKKIVDNIKDTINM
jgi:hypothetical protein